MVRHCPLLEAGGQPQPPTTDKYGAVWDSGLASLCLSRCFHAGYDQAGRTGNIVRTDHVSAAELTDAEGDTGLGEGIRAESPTQRIGFIEIDNGGEPDDLLTEERFPFDCRL